MSTRLEAAAPTHLLAPLLAFGAARGVTLDLASLGIVAGSGSGADDEEIPVTSRQLGAVFDTLADALDEPHLGLLLPGALIFARYELPELVARASPTLRESFQRLARYSSLLSSSLVLGFDESEGAGRLTQRDLGHPRGLSRHLSEFAMAMGAHEARARTGQTLAVREVRFVHARPRGTLDPLRAYFGTSALRFGHAENALVFDAAILDAPLLTADPRLLLTAETLAEEALRRRAPSGTGFRGAIEASVRAHLAHPELSMRTIAHAARMSTRTLQRRLEAEGTSFAEVLDGVRETAARELLAAPSPSLTEVAFQLGFAEFATFSRAFKRWTGESPGAFRQRAGRA